ncbi:MAG TPA: AzlD domain-containing protein [Streptosporangiaceae bacterium]|jgi:hypothetical protein
MMGSAGSWVMIAVTAAGCYALKVAGVCVPARWLEHPGLRRFAALAPVALLAALTAVQTFGHGKGLTIDARAAGVAAAGVALLLRAPFLVVVVVAAAVTAGLRLLL